MRGDAGMSTNQSNAKYLNIRDIAKLAGVSTATVSRVLNHPELTSPEIRARVQAIVQGVGKVLHIGCPAFAVTEEGQILPQVGTAGVSEIHMLV